MLYYNLGIFNIASCLLVYHSPGVLQIFVALVIALM